MKAQQLKNAILQLAIQGKLVPQDPNDEPASVLLEKIQAEKAKLIAEGKIKKSRKTSDKHPSTTESEFPFEIPESWVWTTLGEILYFINGDRGKNYPSKDKLHSTGIPFISAINLDKGTVSDSKLLYLSNEQYQILGGGKLEKNDIIFCLRGSLGKNAIYPFENGAIASSLVILRNYSQYIFLYFLYHYLNSPIILEEINKYNNGTAQPNLSSSNLECFLIPLPPLNEQKRIVAKLEEILPFIDEYDKKEQKLTTLNQQFPEQLKKSILQAAIQGKLVEQDPNDEPASELIKRIQAEKERLISEKKIKKPKVKSEIILRDNLPYEIVDGVERCIVDEVPFEIPESWVWVRLGDIGVIQTGNTPSKENKNNYSSNDFPFFKPSDLNQNHNIVNSKEFLSIEGKSIARVIEKDSLLVNGIGNIGQVGILRVEGAFNQQMHSLTPYNEININFLYYFVKSDTIQNQMKSLSSKTTIPIMNKSSFESIIFPFPPLNEQKRIVQKIEELFSYIKHL